MNKSEARIRLNNCIQGVRLLEQHCPQETLVIEDLKELVIVVAAALVAQGYITLSPDLTAMLTPKCKSATQ